MAAAEARAAWQRAANRCIVQEDAKRAPKLPPCCNSSSSSSSSQSHDSDSGNYQNTPNQTDHPQISNFTPLNWNPLGPANHLQSDTKWWLQFQPNFAYQKEFLYYDQLNLLRDEKKQAEFESESSKFDDFGKVDEYESNLEHMWNVSTACMKQGNFEKDKKIKCEVNKSCEDLLIKKKNEPWWKVADEKELASIVAQKTRETVENCDLPKPTVKTVHYVCDDFVGGGVERNYYEDEGVDLILPPFSKVFYPEVCDETQNDKYFRRTESYNTDKNDSGERNRGGERNRAELLEALCHSQTRARKAELAAKKSEGEKDDIIKLLFRQASHLFACKQWLKLLQLENMCLQLRLNQNLSPPSKDRREKERTEKGRREKGKSICKYVVLFAVGLGLAGAGLLFGWTLGWLL
ncbi:hypothetical protein LUZ60_015772 [Juncus effusus]|nr:hypothetical protein LUZ60_015772 [Juncus effusus]